MHNIAFVGIDPGLTGAVALIYKSLASEEWQVAIADTPLIERKTKKEKTTYDPLGMHTLIYDIDRNTFNVVCVLEEPHAMRNGSIANFSLGYGLGLWRMSLLGYPDWMIEMVSPNRWKKKLGLSSDKNYSRQKAIELFPFMHDKLKLVKNHGRAEALLLAEYGRRLHSNA